MVKGTKAVVCLLLAATALATPHLAMANGVKHAKAKAAAAPNVREVALADRLAKLEAELTQLRADLAKNRAAPSEVVAVQAAAAKTSADAATAQAVAATRTAEVASAKANEAVIKVAAVETEAKKIGFRNGNTQVTLNGYVKMLASSARYSSGDDPTNSLGRDLYLPQSVPVYNPAAPTSATRVTDFSAKQTRFWVDASTKLGQHDLKAYIEFDFQAAPGTPMALGQGTQRTTNAYDLAMRRAFIKFDRWTMGQDFTNFGMLEALPESTDYVGGVDGVVFVRQPQLRYSYPLNAKTTLHVAVENPETASATVGAAALIENGEDHAPDATARLSYSDKFGRIDLSGILRQLRVDYQQGVVAGTTGRVTDSYVGWGVNASGKIFLNDKRTSDLRFEATYGEGIGRYLGLNFSPDAVLVKTTGKLAHVQNLGLYASGHIALNPQWRVNLIGSYQEVYYATALDRTSAGIGAYNKQAWSGAVNLFYSPVKNIDLGVEYRRGHRELVSGLNGNVDRMDFAAKYTF